MSEKKENIVIVQEQIRAAETRGDKIRLEKKREEMK